jgi:acetyl-CoA acyltransferase
MGQSAERMAKENGISREQQDRWALRSHQLAAEGTRDGRLKADIVPVYVPPHFEQHLDHDNGIRDDSTLEKLAQLPPVFDRKYGSVTAGNSSPLTDGASAILLMSEEKAKALGHQPLAYIRSWAYSALAPSAQLLQGPAYAAPVALERAGLSMQDIELMEMHEAFASQVLSNLQALDSDEFARKELNRSAKVGIPEESRINVMGGSIAIGHPLWSNRRPPDDQLGAGARPARSIIGFDYGLRRGRDGFRHGGGAKLKAKRLEPAHFASLTGWTGIGCATKGTG